MNPHALAGTSPSSWRVCRFRHSDWLFGHRHGTVVNRTDLSRLGPRPTNSSYELLAGGGPRRCSGCTALVCHVWGNQSRLGPWLFGPTP